MTTEIPTTQESTLDLSANGIWQRLPRESGDSYAAFCVYLDLGADSTLQQVADKTGRSLEAVRHLSSRHNWMDRGAAYRQHVSHELLAAANRQRAKQTELCQARDQILRQEFWEDGQILRSAFRQAIHKWMNDPDAKIAPYEMARFMDLFFKLTCRSTQPTGFTSEGPAPSHPDFKDSIDKIYGGDLNLDQLLGLIRQVNPSILNPAPANGNGSTHGQNESTLEIRNPKSLLPENHQS